MTHDRPTPPDAVRVDPKPPLPGRTAPEGRWATPYRDRHGAWRCYLWRPLTATEARHGMRFGVVADDREGLTRLMLAEDEKYAELRAVRPDLRDDPFGTDL
ncbi:hypothetical protein [Actinomadura atramentaria]|uniref:hypothetical protein n=1 Tax=Actinomadura atramentaria TaxID=1990 RepID=UPI00037A8960|nr:hypothetical protein [Actinomadura atramentaria]